MVFINGSVDIASAGATGCDIDGASDDSFY